MLAVPVKVPAGASAAAATSNWTVLIAARLAAGFSVCGAKPSDNLAVADNVAEPDSGAVALSSWTVLTLRTPEPDSGAVPTSCNDALAVTSEQSCFMLAAGADATAGGVIVEHARGRSERPREDTL
jgi:hypothetical protein